MWEGVHVGRREACLAAVLLRRVHYDWDRWLCVSRWGREQTAAAYVAETGAGEHTLTSQPTCCRHLLPFVHRGRGDAEALGGCSFRFVWSRSCFARRSTRFHFRAQGQRPRLDPWS